MGIPIISPIISQPLTVIDELFAENGASSPQVEGDWGVQAHFERCLQDIGAQQIPSLNTENLDAIPPNSLIRFRGMIQDMYNPEYYVGAYQADSECGVHWRTSKFRDSVDDVQTSNSTIWQRKLYLCVPIPGETAWTHSEEPATVPNGAPTSSNKRSREDSIGIANEASEDADTKRQVCGEERMEACEHLQAARSHKPAFPHAGELGNACILKFYGAEGEEFKLNDVVEVVGVLSKTPGLASFESGDDFMCDDDAQPPCSEVVRVHVLLATMSPSFVRLAAPDVPQAVLQEGLQAHAGALRQSLLSSLTAALGGDALAGEYMLLHVLSRVHTRADAVALGKMSLNLSGCPPPAASPAPGNSSTAAFSPVTEALEQVLRSVLPRTSKMPFTVNYMNTEQLVPTKDYEANRLTIGRLQLAEGTHLVVDETALQTGKLEEAGVRNMQSLQQVMTSQQLGYDFKYYEVSMNTDIPVAVLSTGKSVLADAADILLPLRAVAAPGFLPLEDALLAQVRTYVAVARDLPHNMSADMAKVVEDDLVAQRTAGANRTQEDFHRWLNLARSLCISFGETELTAHRWQHMKGMESTREERLRVC
ncbi:hypothetical protein CYMTET_10763 [Cymbomonas tetramitiformis]|uniref:Mini-chromosome maintenance complex-binding protein n=1 Tax=Cymbomonas tetramitiformis TaxID=36881 RepID=A0AAE0GQ24_9CHLO|nr:hypothetical protein CYMTET_10763 [Cymbomonas tetramitiformis]